VSARDVRELRKVCYALHGFLGRPSDWDMLSAKEIAVNAIEKVDILKVASPGASMGMEEWARKFNASVQGNQGQRVLMAYSMGGRLALHALLENPELWQCAILVSTHTGLKTSDEKAVRRVEDEVWAQRFENEFWDNLIDAWNNRDIFVSKNSPFERHENHYARGDLANILRYWSLGSQEEFTEAIGKLPMPILWVVGEEDRNYRARAAAMTFSHPKSRVWVAPGVGHRVPWECSNFQQQVKQFLTE
jgi:2-succinyl-6-hydroxy-2,4-cyclohexadiene-1-carboxylate synthase